MIGRKTENPEIKQWKQENRIISRKFDDNEKTILKLLTTFISANPEKADRCGKLVSEFESNTSKLNKEENAIYGKLRKINEGVNELKQTLKYFDKTNESLLKVQRLSEGIFEKMEHMKGDMATSYDELDQLEHKYSADLELYDHRIEGRFEGGQEQHKVVVQHKNKQNFYRNNKEKKKKIEEENEDEIEVEETKLQIIEARMKSKEEEVEEVQTQIRELGKNLGWHEEDHKDFITIWNRCHPHKNYFQIEDELAEYFRVYTSEQIQDHMNKYIKLKKLLQKKKDLISHYKSLKEQKRAEEIIILESNQYEKEKKKKKEEDVKKMEIQQKQMKEKVQLWKKKKQQEKKMERLKIEEGENRKRAEEMNRRREEEMKRRQVLQKWKEEKEEKQKQSMRQSARRPNSAVNKETRERIRERQEQLMKEKMEKAIQKKLQREEMQKKAEKMREQKMIKYAHVGSKLEEKTTAIKEKQRDKFDGKDKKDAQTFGGQLLMTGVRAVPTWMKGI